MLQVMTYDFYAAFDDQVAIVEYVLKEMCLQIYDLGSDYGKEIRKYAESSMIAEKLKTERGQLNFHLWSPQFGGGVEIRKVKLDPKYCNGHTFRYATEGLGLIQFYLGGHGDGELVRSHIGHFNERGAIGREEYFKYKAKQWNWKEIEKASRKLKSHIQKQSVKGKDGYDIMIRATELK